MDFHGFVILLDLPAQRDLGQLVDHACGQGEPALSEINQPDFMSKDNISGTS